ncbi:histidine phosphatase family protein [Rossellomorea aquimaris]|uniref:histidine phosphatase family protein n=1 Tax=Rossellomorea aquimaris TaxID=189382 RepID=UPI001CD509B2|nr:histidine phosphatase family protein [Rossellomorea aquimaris]MCA1054030.1 histidine phosphatase family protein [Rossellomorea aquimaris]
MNTAIYFVRHGDSPKYGDERSRGLTSRGKMDTAQVTSCLINEGIDAIFSSPYERAIQTVQPLADSLGKKVIVREDLKERIFTQAGNRLSDQELLPLLEQSFSNPSFQLEGAESNFDCQNRAVGVINEMLEHFKGQKIVVGTHGAIMTLVMSYFDEKYDLDFLLGASKPDIYRMVFSEEGFIGVERLWNEKDKLPQS